MYLKRRLSAKEIALIESSGLTDIKLIKEPSRFYPIQSVGPIVGITDIDNQGLFGIESLYNTTLAGKPTTYIVEKDARSGRFYFTRQTKVEGAEAQPLSLTIDSVLQFLAYEELKDYVKQMGLLKKDRYSSSIQTMEISSLWQTIQISTLIIPESLLTKH